MKVMNKDTSWSITISLMIFSGILLWIIGSLARNFPEMVEGRNIFGVVLILTTLVLLIYHGSKNKQKGVVGFLPLIPERKRIFGAIVAGLVVGGLYIIVFKDTLPFSFQFLFAMEKPQELILTWYTALMVFSLLYPFIEEMFMSWIPNTIARALKSGGFSWRNALIMGVIGGSVLFTVGHVTLGLPLNLNFLFACFTFSAVGRLLNLYFHSALPWILGHSLNSAYVIGIIFGLSFTQWIIPIVIIVVPLLFLSTKKR